MSGDKQRALLRLISYACVEARRQGLNECSEHLETAAILLWKKQINNGSSALN